MKEKKRKKKFFFRHFLRVKDKISITIKIKMAFYFFLKRKPIFSLSEKKERKIGTDIMSSYNERVVPLDSQEAELKGSPCTFFNFSKKFFVKLK